MAKNPAAKVILRDVRFCFPHLFEPDSMAGKYTCRFLIRKDNPQVEEVKSAIRAAAQDGAAILNGKKVMLSDILHDGDVEGKSAEYEGMYYLNSKSGQKPGVVKKNTNGLGGLIDVTDPSDVYGGCWGMADIYFYAFNRGGHTGIACALNNVCKMRDDEPLSGKGSAASVFGGLIEDESNDYDDSL